MFVKVDVALNRVVHLAPLSSFPFPLQFWVTGTSVWPFTSCWHCVSASTVTYACPCRARVYCSPSSLRTTPNCCRPLHGPVFYQRTFPTMSSFGVRIETPIQDPAQTKLRLGYGCVGVLCVVCCVFVRCLFFCCCECLWLSETRVLRHVMSTAT